MKQKLLFILVSSFLLSQDLDHIIFSRVTITPTEAEMVAIYNPADTSINLLNYYLTDAEKPSTSKHYYNLPSGQDFWSGSVSDFIVRFPDIDILPNDTLYIGLHDIGDFNNYYNSDPDLTLWDNMLSIGDDNTLPFNSSFNVLGENYEMLMLFYWDGVSDQVEDVDYFLWGDTTYAVNKSGIDNYLNDTPLITQYENLIRAHGEDSTFVRNGFIEEGEISPGNGITGDDETSEIFHQSWNIIINPGIIYGCTDSNAYNYNEQATTDDGTCINVTHTVGDIVTGSTEGYTATVAALIVGFEDIRPAGGPQVIILQDDDGYQVDAVVWDWDVATSGIGYVIDPYNPSEYVVGVTGTVGTYNGSWQFDIAQESDVVILDSYNPEGSFIEDNTIISAKIETAPYVIIPSIGERLDFIYSFPSNSRIVVRVFDLNGRFITSIVDRYYESGGTVERLDDNSEWDGTNHLGQVVDPGTYLMHIEAFNFQTGETTYDVAPIVVGVHY